MYLYKKCNHNTFINVRRKTSDKHFTGESLRPVWSVWWRDSSHRTCIPTTIHSQSRVIQAIITTSKLRVNPISECYNIKAPVCNLPCILLWLTSTAFQSHNKTSVHIFILNSGTDSRFCWSGSYWLDGCLMISMSCVCRESIFMESPVPPWKGNRKNMGYD